MFTLTGFPQSREADGKCGLGEQDWKSHLRIYFNCRGLTFIQAHNKAKQLE
jgi:hypothetical protein